MNDTLTREPETKPAPATAYYVAFYRLHDIPWEVEPPLRYRDTGTGIHIEVGPGPYYYPGDASPEVTTRAGGATIQGGPSGPVTLQGGMFIAVVIPTDPDPPRATIAWNQWWDGLEHLADQFAAAVGVCLRQRRAAEKAADYVRVDEGDRIGKRMMFRWHAYPGHRTAITDWTREEIRLALERVLAKDLTPQTYTALSWLDRSKGAASGADRLVGLWTALEALFGPVRTHPELVRRAAEELGQEHYGLGLTRDEVIEALGLNQMREWRRRIVHHGERPQPWPFSPDPENRDYPQMLDDIVTEILRHRLGAGPTTAVREHVRRWKDAKPSTEVSGLARK